MSIRFVLPASEEAQAGEDTQHLQKTKELLEECSEGDVQFSLHESEHGIGAGWLSVVVEYVIPGVFFGIPTLRKKIKDACEGWKEIKESLDRFRERLSRHKKIASYSAEVAYLEALQYLEQTEKVEVSELELTDFVTIPGKSSASVASFDNTDLFYYLFVFREDQERAYVLLYSSQCVLISAKAVSLDTRLGIGAEVPNIEQGTSAPMLESLLSTLSASPADTLRLEDRR